MPSNGALTCNFTLSVCQAIGNVAVSLDFAIASNPAGKGIEELRQSERLLQALRSCLPLIAPSLFMYSWVAAGCH